MGAMFLLCIKHRAHGGSCSMPRTTGNVSVFAHA